MHFVLFLLQHFQLAVDCSWPFSIFLLNFRIRIEDDRGEMRFGGCDAWKLCFMVIFIISRCRCWFRS